MMKKKLYTEAVEYFSLGAGKGDAEAKCCLGICNYIGKGTEQNYSDAFKLLKESSEGGCAEGTFMLGACYRTGRGTARDWKKAAELYQNAIENGCAGAASSLAWMHEDGEYFKEDMGEAYQLYKLADYGDYPWGTKNLSEFSFSGSSEEQRIREETKLLERFQMLCDENPSNSFDITIRFS